MALFPQSNAEFHDERDRSLLKTMEEFYAQSISINQAFWAEADMDTRFEAGDQTLWNDLYSAMPSARRKNFNFNRIKRVVNMISGHQRRNRKSTIVTPVENGDALTADQFTKILMWINQREGVLETVSEAFNGALITGLNLLQVWVDYRVDPISGSIKVDNCPYNSFLMDPFFRKKDLSDCNALWKRSYLSKFECLSLLPEHEDLIEALSGSVRSDGKFNHMPETTNAGGPALLTYDEYYYKTHRKQKLLVDTQTGETLEWKGQDDERLSLFLQTYPTVIVTNQEVPTVNVAIVLQGKVVYDGINPLGIDTYPFVPVFGYHSPELSDYSWRVQGIVRGLRDAQYLYNRRKVIELDILESQVNSGWKYKENALVDPRDIYLAGQGRGVAVKAEAMMSDVERIQPASIPSSMIALSESLANELQQISGVNEELLGAAADDKAGILAMLRQGAGLTTLQTLFDQLDYSQRLLGKIMIQIIQSNFTPGKVQRIIEQEPTPQFYNKAFGRYDAAVEEGLNTTTQRQMQFAQLLQLREVGVPIPDDILVEACTVQEKQKLMERLAQSADQNAQMQQMQAQVSMQEIQARTELAQARAIADRGLGVERISRVQENRALAIERLSEAEREQATAKLDLVRAIKEIQNIDIGQVEKLLSMVNVVENTDKQGKENVVKNNESRANIVTD